MTRLVGLALLALAALPASALSQVEAEPVLAGRVLLGDSALPAATVVLHRMSEQTAAEVDSMRATADGSFGFALPSVPNPALGELYVASVRHHGVMYFGPTVETAVQLDSLYLIHAYDTLVAPDEGVDVALQSRSIFLEPTGDAWQATDVFQLRNDRDRTVVARPGGRVWSYPLPAVAREVMTGEGEFAGVVTFEDGSLVVRAALSPGERLFVVRYLLDSPAVSIPSPGETEVFDLLVREPAPALDVDPMQQVESVALEAGQTFRRYAAENLTSPVVTITLGEANEPPPVHWIAVVLALVLTGGALLALRTRSTTPRRAVAPHDRRAILMQLARLDEEFERRDAPTPAQRREYQRRRAELIWQLEPGG